jgi:hypothetical protein
MWILIVIGILVFAVLILAGRRQRRLGENIDPMSEQDRRQRRPPDDIGWGGWGNGGGFIGG